LLRADQQFHPLPDARFYHDRLDQRDAARGQSDRGRFLESRLPGSYGDDDGQLSIHNHRKRREFAKRCGAGRGAIEMELLREYRLPALVGLLLLLNVTGIFPSVFGLDTALLVTALAGYKTFHNSISALLEKKISTDVALCVAVVAALVTG